MPPRRRLVVASVGTVLLFFLIQLGALALVTPFIEAGYQAVENPNDPVNSGMYFGAILIATGILLVAIKWRFEWVLRVLVTMICGVLSLYVFLVLIPPWIAPAFQWVIPIGLAGLVVVVLYVYPEWYVIDAVGVIIGAGGAGLFGISFGPLPAIVLLSGLAVYDAISVYRTKHMLTLAESVTDLKLPLVLVVPVRLTYSFLADESIDVTDPTDGDLHEREAFFIGLGDTVMPTILVASAAVFSAAQPIRFPWLTVNLPALGAAGGTILGLIVLLWLVEKGRPHAGLPLLNGGAIAGYLIASNVVGIGLIEAIGLAPFL